jgi:hypothetical protein
MAGPDGEPDDVVVELLTPEASFERLAHELRVAIVRTLDADGPLRHGALRERTGADDPGRFNYHLQKLEGHFVRKVDERYELTPAGRRVVGAVRSGGYTSDLAGTTVPADADCLRCDGPLATEIKHGGVVVACQDCGQRFNGVDIPPGALAGADLSELYGLVDRWVKRRLVGARLGFCHRCDGPLDRRLVRVEDEGAWADRDTEWLGDLPVEVLLRHRCERCGNERHVLFAAAVALHPAIVSFHHEHGVDVFETPFTEYGWLSMGAASVLSMDPLRVEIPITLDDETLHATFDAEVSLVEERRG